MYILGRLYVSCVSPSSFHHLSLAQSSPEQALNKLCSRVPTQRACRGPL